MVTRIGLLAVAMLCLASSLVAEESKPVELNQLRLYVPVPQLED
jgi:hypothetical protein